MTKDSVGAIFMLTFELNAIIIASGVSIFSDFSINFSEVLCIKTEYISKEDLERIVKTHGDKIVVGYRRFKKVKKVSGYKKLEEIVSNHLSVITKAYLQEKEGYVAVVRFQIWPFLIFLILIGLIFIALQKPFKANIKEPEPFIDPEIPTIKEVETGTYEGKFISVPGYVKEEISSKYMELEVRNPEINDCIIVYELYYKNVLIGSSGDIYPGNKEKIEISEKLAYGIYDMRLIAKGYSLDKKTQYNSVSQKLELIIC